MNWVRPDREIIPHTHANAQLNESVMVVFSRKLDRKYPTHRVLNPGPVVCESITLSDRQQLLPMFFCSTIYIQFSLLRVSEEGDFLLCNDLNFKSMHTEGDVARRRAPDPWRKIRTLLLYVWHTHCKRLDAAKFHAFGVHRALFLYVVLWNMSHPFQGTDNLKIEIQDFPLYSPIVILYS